MRQRACLLLAHGRSFVMSFGEEEMETAAAIVVAGAGAAVKGDPPEQRRLLDSCWV